MKKAAIAFSFAVLVLTMVFSCARGYESQKSAGDLKVTLSVDRYPLVKGDNSLAVKVSDVAGKTITDATVGVRYFMPPMAGMAPMEYRTQAAQKGDGFSFSANIPMEGGWKAEVSVARGGKPVVTATFNVDAR
ncbi:MAG: FixH family protein [Nitrospirae bacterium]|nr:FixH family protein [Nitrospirota bacterium]